MKLPSGDETAETVPMRCYFLRDNKIEAVYFLTSGSDEELIRQSQALFDKLAGPNIQDFEVWDGRRFVYRTSPRRERDAGSI